MLERKRLYYVWWEMKRRCTDKKYRQYKDYGGRGISVSNEWMDFQTFLNDMGERPAGATIERINNDLGYSKENCKWSLDRSEQSINRRIFSNNKTGIKNIELRDDGSFRIRVRRNKKIIFDNTIKDFFEACCLLKSFYIKKLEALSV